MQVLCLPSGERVVGGVNSGLRLVLETGNLHTATPASLHACVSVCVSACTPACVCFLCELVLYVLQYTLC